MKKSLLLVAGIVPLLIFVGLRKNSAPFFSVKAYTCIHDESLSDDYCALINMALAGMLNENCAAHLIIDHLKKQFPVLKKVVLSYRPSVTHVMISAYEPVCSVNNSAILTDTHEFFPKNIFSAEAIVDIPNIAVSCLPLQARKSEVGSLLQGAPQGVHERYNLELINEHCVHFVDKEQPNFTIVSFLAQEKSPQLLAKCESVKQTIDARGAFDKGVKWIADTRFAHYIVAYKA